MKTIPANAAANPKWDNKLINDLSFIKSKLRYPLTFKVIYPVVLLGAVIVGFILFVADLTSSNPETHNNWVRLLVFGILVVTTAINLVRYLQTLRFTALPTQYGSGHNQELLKQFLDAQHLLVFRHPNAPEVFQIASEAIDALNGQREVVIFIADEKRILINSHFTYSTKISFHAGKRHHRQMANMLKNWLAAHSAPSNSVSLSL